MSTMKTDNLTFRLLSDAATSRALRALRGGSRAG